MTIPIKAEFAVALVCAALVCPQLLAQDKSTTDEPKGKPHKLAMAEQDRMFDPFGVIKDGELEPPKEPEVIKPSQGTEVSVRATPFQDQVERHVRIMAINAVRGKVYIGSRPYQKGDTITIKTGGTPLQCKLVAVDSSGIVLQDVHSEQKAAVSHGR